MACQPIPCNPPNPSSSSSSFSSQPVRYANGEVKMTITDLGSSGFGQVWGHTRSYSNQLTDQTGGANGNSWFIDEVPQLVQVSLTEICFISNIQEALWFDLDSGSWVPDFFVLDNLVEDTTNHQFVYTDTSGRKFKFFDFSTNHVAAKRGQFKSFTDPYGAETTATYGSDDRIASFLLTSGGSSSGYYYTYLASGDANAGKLQYVTLQVNAANVRRCKYDYYGSSDSNGSLGDLKRVTTQEYISGSWVDVKAMLYRYYKADETNGFASALKFVLGP